MTPGRSYKGLGVVQQKCMLALLRHGELDAEGIVRAIYPVIPQTSPYQNPDMKKRVQQAIRPMCARGLVNAREFKTPSKKGKGRTRLAYNLTTEGRTIALEIHERAEWEGLF